MSNFPSVVHELVPDYSYIYSEDLLKEICKRLNSSKLSKSDITDIIFSLADDYRCLKAERDSSFTPNDAISKIDSFIKSQEKSLQKFEHLMQDKKTILSFGGIQMGIKHRCDHDYEIVGAVDFIHTVERALEILKGMKDSHKDKPTEYFGIPIAHPLQMWVMDMEVLFNGSQIKFAQPKYDPELGYQSECLNILFEIMKPLDSEIEEQQIAEQMKIVNSKKFQSLGM